MRLSELESPKQRTRRAPSGLDRGGERLALLKVLIVDDDPDDRILLRDLIEDESRSIICDVESTYEDGLSAILGGGYDAFLVDYRLGARSGVDLIREAGHRSDGPMILLTGVGSIEVDEESLAAGAADYLVKRGLTTEIAHRSIRYSVEMWRSRRQAEIDRARYQSLFDGVPVGLVRTSPDGLVIEANATAVSMLGHPSRDSLIGLHLGDLASDRGWFDLELGALDSGHHSRSRDLELPRTDGTSLWVTFALRPVPSDDGGIDWVEWALTDISPRKQAEHQAELRETLLDQVRSAVIVTDLDGICTYWNRHAEEMYGWKSVEAIGRPIVELTVVDDDHDLASEIMAEISRSGHWEGEFPVRRRDGSRFVAQVQNSVLRDDAGRPTGVVGVSMDLTATKKREIELRQSQELVNAAFDGSPVGKAIVSVPEGKIVSCNQALASFLGASVADLQGMHFAEYTHPDDVAIDVHHFTDLIEGRTQTYNIDKRYIRTDGTVIWGSLRASLIRDESGKIRFGVGQVIDITARRAAEDRIRFQASLLDQVHHAVMATDLEGTLIYWNRHAEKLYGWSAEEAIGHNVFDVTAPDAASGSLAGISASLAEHGTWEGEVELARRDGSTFPAWASDTVLRDESGAPIGVVGVKVDLTDVRHAELRAEREKALNATLLASVDVPIAIIDHTGFVSVSNASWRRLVADDPECGYIPRCLSISSDPKTVGALHDGVVSVLDGTRDRFQLEYECHEDSEPNWIRTTIVATSDGGAVVVHWNITDERIAQTTLEETIRAKDQFMASISHELRTPLTAVVGMADLLRSGEHPPEERSEFEAILAEQANEISLIVEDLLVAGRLESQTLTVKSSTIDIAAEVKSVLCPLERYHPVEIDLDIATDAVVAHADPLRFRQILRNLVTNSIRYGAPPITVTARCANGAVVVSVVDHGDGIPAGAVEHMFKPYARFGESEGQPLSVGLGLHVGRRLAQLMGGDLGYRREAGTTVFTLTLPAPTAFGPPPGRGRPR